MNCYRYLLNSLFVVAFCVLPTLAWGTERQATVSCTITPVNSGCGWNWADGDTLVIGNNVTVTVPFGGTVIAGPDDGATVAVRNVTTAGTGVLVVNGTLQLKGDVQQANAAWIVNADGVASQGRIEHAGATAHYTWQIGMASNQRNARLVLAGTGPRAGRVVVTNAAGAARFGGFHQGNSIRQSTANTILVSSGGTAVLGGGNLVATWTTFQDLGYEIFPGLWQDWLTASQYYDYNETSLDHCLVIGCTLLRTVNTSVLSGTGSIFRISNTSFLSPLSLYSINPQHLTAKSAGGVRLIQDSVIEGTFVAGGLDYTFDNTLLAGKRLTGAAPMLASSGRTVKINNMSDILIWNRLPDNSTGVTTTSIPYGGLIERLVSIRAEGFDDDHFRLNGYPATESTTVFDGVVLERCPGAHSNGAAFIGYTNKAAKITLSNVLDVPTIDYYGNLRPSTLSFYSTVATSATSGLSVQVQNVTRYAGDLWLFTTFESTAGNPGVMAGVYNNLLWSYVKVTKQTWCAQSKAVAVNNSITGAGYNATFNVNADGYANLPQTLVVPASAYAAPPGTGDFSSDPQFVDSSRNLLLWARQFNPSIATYDEVLSEFLKRNNDDGFDPRFDFREYYQWVRMGFMPQNRDAFTASGKNGTYVGAVEPVDISATPIDARCGSDNGKTLTSAPESLCVAGKPASLAGTGPWTWACLGINGGRQADCSAAVQTYSLAVTISGSGTVAATPDVLAWSSAQGVGTYNHGAQVTLRPTPTPVSGNVFKGWSGACSGMGDTANGYACTVTMTADTVVTATFGLVTVNKNPSVALITPVNGSVFNAPATIVLNATAIDSDGSIARVDFFSGSYLLFSDTSAPYSYTWNNVPAGIYTLSAVTYDNSGASSRSASATVRVLAAGTNLVTYNGNGNTGGAPPSDPNSPYAQGATVTVLDNTGRLVRTGYVFTGWNTKADGSGSYYTAGSTFVTSSSSIILYAQWALQVTYAVIYSGNGNTGGTVPVDAAGPYVQGATVTVLGNTGSLLRTGYLFTGWNTRADGTGATYAAGSTFVMGAAGVILYAQWTLPASFAVTYSGNGSTSGTAPVDSARYAQGARVTVQGIGDLARTGYSFYVWNTSADGSGTAYAPNATITIGATNVTLYAIWSLITDRPNYALLSNGAKASASSAGSTFPASRVIDGYRTGLKGYWTDVTSNLWPDWVQITFNGPKTISEIDVITCQNSLASATEPVAGVTTFTANGVTAYDVQYWNGSSYVTLQSVTGNNLVWRRITFPPVTTSYIMISVKGGQMKNSCLAEIEAYQ